MWHTCWVWVPVELLEGTPRGFGVLASHQSRVAEGRIKETLDFFKTMCSRDDIFTSYMRRDAWICSGWYLDPTSLVSLPTNETEPLPLIVLLHHSEQPPVSLPAEAPIEPNVSCVQGMHVRLVPPSSSYDVHAPDVVPSSSCPRREKKKCSSLPGSVNTSYTARKKRGASSSRLAKDFERRCFVALEGSRSQEFGAIVTRSGKDVAKDVETCCRSIFITGTRLVEVYRVCSNQFPILRRSFVAACRERDSFRSRVARAGREVQNAREAGIQEGWEVSRAEVKRLELVMDQCAVKRREAEHVAQNRFVALTKANSGVSDLERRLLALEEEARLARMRVADRDASISSLQFALSDRDTMITTLEGAMTRYSDVKRIPESVRATLPLVTVPGFGVVLNSGVPIIEADLGAEVAHDAEDALSYVEVALAAVAIDDVVETAHAADLPRCGDGSSFGDEERFHISDSDDDLLSDEDADSDGDV